jgi:hypothetical protein
VLKHGGDRGVLAAFTKDKGLYEVQILQKSKEKWWIYEKFFWNSCWQKPHTNANRTKHRPSLF